MTDRRLDPDAPLPGPPDPWASTDAPSRRDGPPYHMTEMIEAEPAIARRLLTRLAHPTGDAAALATAVLDAVRAGDPVVITGCGTSEHGALAAADILGDALRAVGGAAGGAGLAGARPVATQAFELSLDPPSRGLVIGISHEGATGATNAALAAARAAGARTALVTVTRRSPGAALADLVVETGELDQSWCHTVGYLAPLLTAAAVGAHVSGVVLDVGAAVDALASGVRQIAEAEAIAARLRDTDHVVVIASGVDRTAGRELVLKIEEGTWIPSAFRDLETFLHGHLAATAGRTGLVLVLADREARAERVGRARGALRAAAAVGIRSAAIVAAGAATSIDAELTPAGRMVVPDASSLPVPVAALLATATPLQLLTERLARARGTDPDPIRRDDARYLEAAEAADRP